MTGSCYFGVRDIRINTSGTYYKLTMVIIRSAILDIWQASMLQTGAGVVCLPTLTTTGTAICLLVMDTEKILPIRILSPTVKNLLCLAQPETGSIQFGRKLKSLSV